MEYRAGKCSQCGAEYQVPASFAHNVARCKKCGVGVVHLGAPKGAGTAAGSPVPASPTRPAGPEPSAVRKSDARAAAGPETDEEGLENRSSPRERSSSASVPSTADAAHSRPRERSTSPARAAQESESGRKPQRSLLVFLLLLLVAALLCFYFFYVRGRTSAAREPLSDAGRAEAAPQANSTLADD